VRKLFSTKEFTPGHVAGTLILLFGTIELAKFAIRRHQAALGAASSLVARRGEYRAR